MINKIIYFFLFYEEECNSRPQFAERFLDLRNEPPRTASVDSAITNAGYCR